MTRLINPSNLKPGHQLLLGNRLIIVSENLRDSSEPNALPIVTYTEVVASRGLGQIVFANDDPIEIEN